MTNFLQAITPIVVAALTGGGLFGFFFSRKTVKAQAESVNITTAKNVVSMVNAEMQRVEKSRAHERAEWERRDQECDRRLKEMQKEIDNLKLEISQLRKGS